MKCTHTKIHKYKHTQIQKYKNTWANLYHNSSHRCFVASLRMHQALAWTPLKGFLFIKGMLAHLKREIQLKCKMEKYNPVKWRNTNKMSNEKNTKSISCLHHSILQMLPIAAIQYHSKDKNDNNVREKRKKMISLVQQSKSLKYQKDK